MKKVFLMILLLISFNNFIYADDNVEKVSTNIVLYNLTLKDKLIINKLIVKIKKLIVIKGDNISKLLISRIENAQNKKTLSPRIDSILTELKIRLININNPDFYNNEKQESINYLNEYNIDLVKVKNTWLGWYNNERTKLGKKPYTYNTILEKSAINWSNTSKEKGIISHKRNSGDSYYNYNKITTWFKNNGVVCKNINRITHSENLGGGIFKCSDSECSDEFIKGIRSTFDFYMSEKNKKNRDHYNSLINNYFSQIGIGFAIVKQKENVFKYYLTVHYCTELIK